MIKLLMGGSPCTHWSIAQTKNRETEPSGIGWELFKNYVIARDKFKPDYFLYENNKSMSSSICEQITRELGVEPILINSALVSAQSRQRLYWVGKRESDGTYSQIEVEQPDDRGILLRDILDSSALSVDINGFIPGEQTDGSPLCFLGGIQNQHQKWLDDGKNYSRNFGQGYRVYGVDGKSTTVTAQSCGLVRHSGLYAVPVGCDVVITDNSIRCQRRDKKHSTVQGSHVNFEDGKTQVMSPSHIPNIITKADSLKSNSRTVYEVKDGLITIKGKQYPIKLVDGFYIIRKLTVTECKRLQTVPDEYVFPVSDTQAYRQLGNGWTVDVIAHLLSHMDGITSEPLEVLSMYDGMSCGHIALDKLGADVAAYYATEIDKYAIQTTMANYPDTIQLGDAFQVREDGWAPKEAQHIEKA